MKKDYRNEFSKIKYLMEYKINDYLNEGRNADKAIQNTYNIIKKYFNNASWLNNVYDNQELNPNNLTLLEYLEYTFRTDYFGTNVSDSVIRLEPIMMNIALQLGFEQNNSDGEKLKRLQDIITYIKVNNKKEGFPIQLNKLTLENTSFESLNKLFGEALDNELTKDDELANQTKNTQINPNYEIIEIHNQEEAKKYGQFSCSTSILCYTTHEEKWKEFTGKGVNKVYLILNKNWKNIPEEFGENNPYDDYGLSMIFLFINPNGNIAYSNTRWNHRTKEHVSNVDHSFTKQQISELLGGVNFNSIFKPYTEEELFAKGYKTINNVKKMLKQKLPLEDIFDEVDSIFDNFVAVSLNEKWSFIINNELVNNGKLWFDEIYDFYKGFVKVEKNDKYSLVNENGELIGDGKLWFDDISYFSNDFIKVKLNDKYSLANKNGELIGNGKLWFEEIRFFAVNFYEVILNGKISLLKRSSNELIGNGKLWFDGIESFDYNFSKVKLNKKYTLLNSENGKLISNGDLWFDDISYFFNGFAMVKLNEKRSFINENGELIGNGKLWVDNAFFFDEDGTAMVRLNNNTFIIDTHGNFYDYKTKQPIPNPLINQQNESVEKLIKNIVKETIKELLIK